MPRPFRDHRPVVLDGDGAGSVTFGPQNARSILTVTRVSVAGPPMTTTPKARVYRGPASDSTFISGTRTGNFDTDHEFNEELRAGEFLTVVWEGGDTGETVTATFAGTEEIEGSL